MFSCMSPQPPPSPPPLPDVPAALADGRLSTGMPSTEAPGCRQWFLWLWDVLVVFWVCFEGKTKLIFMGSKEKRTIKTNLKKKKSYPFSSKNELRKKRNPTGGTVLSIYYLFNWMSLMFLWLHAGFLLPEVFPALQRPTNGPRGPSDLTEKTRELDK